MEDSQKTAVYRWEESAPTGRTLTLDECRALVARVWEDYKPGASPPPVVDGRGTRIARGAYWRINLPRWARTERVVLHEAAHSLLPHAAAHGPVFATLVLDLYARYLKANKAALRSAGVAQRPRRVHFAPAKDVPQPVSRAYRTWKTKLDELRRAVREHEAARPPRN